MLYPYLLFLFLPVLLPSAPNITMAVSHSPTSINLTWTQPEGEVVDSYDVSFSYQGPCTGFNHTNTTTVNGTARQYTLTGLQEFSTYTVTVVAVNGAGRSEESRESVVTMEDGMSFKVFSERKNASTCRDGTLKTNQARCE